MKVALMESRRWNEESLSLNLIPQLLKRSQLPTMETYLIFNVLIEKGRSTYWILPFCSVFFFFFFFFNMFQFHSWSKPAYVTFVLHHHFVHWADIVKNGGPNDYRYSSKVVQMICFNFVNYVDMLTSLQRNSKTIVGQRFLFTWCW